MGISDWPHRVQTPIDPDATLDFVIDWSDWLDTGEALAASSWSASGATVVTSGYDDTSATVWIHASTGPRVVLTNSITTDNTPARIDNRTLIISVAER
jgi:hypothetical protein